MLRILAIAAAILGAPVAASAQDGRGTHSGEGPAAFQSDCIQVTVDGDRAGNGDGRDIILIPGLSSSPQIWQGTVDHLVAQDGVGWRIHRIQVDGFAGAPPAANAQTGSAPTPVAAPVAEEIARYIREQGLTRPAVVGHSMGGTIGLMLAARHPDQVGRLMVVDMVPFMGAMFAAPGATAETAAPIADRIWAAQATSPRDAYVAQATASITGMINTEARRELALQNMRDSDQKVSAAAFRELVATDLRPEPAPDHRPDRGAVRQVQRRAHDAGNHRRHLSGLLRRPAGRDPETDRRQRPLHHVRPAPGLLRRAG